MDVGNCVELLVIVNLPDDFFVGGDFEYLGLFADVAVASPVADDRVAVWKSLDVADKAQRIPFEIVFVDPPDDLVIGVDLDDAVPVSAAYESVAVGQAEASVGIALDCNRANHFSVRIIFPDNAVGIMPDKVVSVGQFSCLAHLGMCIFLAGLEFDRL